MVRFFCKNTEELTEGSMCKQCGLCPSGLPSERETECVDSKHILVPAGRTANVRAINIL